MQKITHTNEWKSEQDKFGMYFLICIIFFVVLFFTNKEPDLSDLKREFKQYESHFVKTGKLRKRTMEFLDDEKSYSIYFYSFDCLDLNKMETFKSGDSLEIQVKDDLIYTLKHKNREILDLNCSILSSRQNTRLLKIVFAFLSFVFFIPSVLKNQPKFKVFGGEYALRANSYFVAPFLILVAILIILELKVFHFLLFY
jgi:hypothetical protein